MAEDTVRIRNGEQESEVVRSAYEKVWKDRGWTIVEDESEAAAQEPTQATAAEQPARQPNTSGTGKTKNEE